MLKFRKDVQLTVHFNEADDDTESANATLFIIDDNGQMLDRQTVAHNKKLVLDEKKLNKGKKVLLTQNSRTLTPEALETAQAISKRQLMRISMTSGMIGVPKHRWGGWFPGISVCVSGQVRKCIWWPLIRQLQSNTLPKLDLPFRIPEFNPRIPKLSLLSEASRLAVPELELVRPLFRRCYSVCEGVVEIYERICCKKLVITPSILDRIRELLKKQLIEIPDIPIPPNPEIDFRKTPDLPPIPTEFDSFFHEGAADELKINAAKDVEALSSLPFAQAQEYVLARPYLVHIIDECGKPVLKGAAALGENGEFNLCYKAPPILVQPGLKSCRREVAFKVIQQTESGPRVIYNGLSAGQWFSPDDDNIVLTTYDWRAIACDDSTPVPGPDGAYVALARIGTGTDSVSLDSPDQTSAYGVTGPFTQTAGLAFPEPNLNLAKGRKKNLNWGGMLPIRIDFSKGMESTKAEYYRISVARANPVGDPIEPTRVYLDSPITWHYNDPELVGGVFTVKKKNITLTEPSNPTFHKIPYDKLIPNDSAWRDNQYHGYIDTTDFANDRYLVTIEVYDSAFKRVVPTGTGVVAEDVNENFSYETWNQVSNTTTVPFAALTHLFWWDNQSLATKIEDLRKNGLPSTAECQFLQKPAGALDALFSTGFRAYHPQHGPGTPDFLMDWTLRWKRGLGGSQALLDQNDESVGFGVGPAVSATENFSTMLGSNTKCTFSLMLFAAAKTWNGSTYINPNGLRDVASFALDLSEPAP